MSEGARRRLLEIARASIEEHLKTGNLPHLQEEDQELLQPLAVFVSLKQAGTLRGCIGSIEADRPLYLAVSSAAVASSTQDPRFPSLSLEELPSTTIEISILSPLKRMIDPAEIQIGVHGLFVSHGNRQGILLPQVALEMGWDREMFLRQVCLKAGLPQDTWQWGAKVYLFTAEVIREKVP
ncbi:MAG: AmmeMemoRadiSam system protein A [candidate division NC10 bacterium]|nr:AmmeMemoRadiSam system protein A [candidate division NC10 bacterium]